MNDTEFHTRATTILDAIEAQADHWFEKLDLDVETKRNGNVLNLIFENGHQVVINSQAPLHEMWLAARSGGFHYRFDGRHWKDTRGGTDLHDTLSAICSEATGKTLTVEL
jgi:CyaY protein